VHKYIIGAAAAFGLLALPLGAVEANASVKPAATFSCRGDGFCGSQEEVNTHLVWAVAASSPKSNTPVVLQYFSNARSSQDFIATDINGLGDGTKRFQFAPNDDKSGLCISQPKATAYTRLVLRPCNNSVFQQFRAEPSPDWSGYAWVSLQDSSLVIQDGSFRGVGNQLNVGPNTWGDNQLWNDNTSSTP